MNIKMDQKLHYLKNGTAVIIRQLHESDRNKIQRGFDAMSQLSRYRRFLQNKTELQQSEIDYLFSTSEKQGVSFIVLECNNTCTLTEGRCIGLIQLLQFGSDYTRAEVALVVIDEFHNCGLGRLLLKTIEKEASNRDIKSLYFYASSDNKPLNAILKRTGWDISIDREFGSVTYVTNMEDNSQLVPIEEVVISTAPDAKSQGKTIRYGQLLGTSWFKFYLRMIICMNQITMHKIMPVILFRKLP